MEEDDSTCIFSFFEKQKAERKRRLNTNDTRLHEAIIKEDTEEVRELVQELDVDQINVRDRRGNPPLHLAIHSQNIDIINLLLNAGADLSWKNGGGNNSFPLHVAYNCSIILNKKK